MENHEESTLCKGPCTGRCAAYWMRRIVEKVDNQDTMDWFIDVLKSFLQDLEAGVTFEWSSEDEMHVESEEEHEIGTPEEMSASGFFRPVSASPGGEWPSTPAIWRRTPLSDKETPEVCPPS